MLSTFIKSSTKSLSAKVLYPVAYTVTSRSISFFHLNGSHQDSFYSSRYLGLDSQSRGSFALVKRSFSSKELALALSKEIKAEKEQEEVVDDEYETVKKAIESSFKIVDTPGVTIVQFQKQSSKESLVISFDCSGMCHVFIFPTITDILCLL